MHLVDWIGAVVLPPADVGGQVGEGGRQCGGVLGRQMPCQLVFVQVAVTKFDYQTGLADATQAMDRYPARQGRHVGEAIMQAGQCLITADQVVLSALCLLCLLFAVGEVVADVSGSECSAPYSSANTSPSSKPMRPRA